MAPQTETSPAYPQAIDQNSADNPQGQAGPTSSSHGTEPRQATFKKQTPIRAPEPVNAKGSSRIQDQSTNYLQ
ncbi:Hypothetical predicted protein [Pelobates cultripes]|uniref:Uncharacterized protein n=1 Tax=Pelobates cultripes TaxID=61616 RepID=A0AAD1SWD8_PELCU|nr:Hypothetical predicted protein [Pelobates cultripes]CAH2327388.1 Hypothetical predicted protein [Pelobates cultripes]